MIKKILKGFGLLVLALFLGAAIYWYLNGQRLQEEYAAFKKTAAPIFMYHAVETPGGDFKWPKGMLVPEQLFKEQMEYLKDQGYRLLTVEQLAERLQTNADVDKYAALTFDDGYKDNYSVVLPILEKYGAKATFFVVNKDIGDWLHMDQKEIKALMAAGMELGSHTTSHAPLDLIEEHYLPWELATARFNLKVDYDRYVVRSLSYPNGGYNKTVISEAERYGFYRAVTGNIGVNTAATYKAAPMEMYRINVVDDGNGLQGFKNRLERAYFFGFLQTKGFDINVIRRVIVRIR